MWLGFLILAFITICVQTALAPHVEVLHARPDLMLLLVIFYGIHARGFDGLLTAWVAGLLTDLSTQEPLGLFCVLYSVVALILMQAREMVFRDHLMTHVVLTFLFALAVKLALAVYVSWRYELAASANSVYFSAVVSALYTTALAPLVQYPLLRLQRALALRAPIESDRRAFRH
jgi:rod shape-determining protein MreD